MVEVDLKSVRHYPPLDERTPEQLFELGCQMARTLKKIRVRAPAGDQPGETVVLDGQLLSKNGVEVF